MNMDIGVAEAAVGGGDAGDLRAYAERGDGEAFGRVVRRHVDMVYSLCRRELRDEHLAEDAVQAVFMLLARKANAFGDGGRVAGWLYEASRNCCRNARRAQSRRVRHEAAAATEREMRVTSATAGMEEEELRDAVHGALASLHAREREVLLMRYFSRMSAREVAGALGVTEEAAKQRVARAVRKLREVVSGRAEVTSGWLESGVVLAAPAGLGERACDAAMTGTGGNAAAIAKGVVRAKQVKMTGVILVAVIVGSGVIAAGVRVAGASRDATAPVAPAVVAPAVVGAVVAEASDRSSPLACIAALGARLKALDVRGAQDCIFDDGSGDAKMILHGITLDVAQIRLNRAIAAEFGAGTRPFVFTTPETSMAIDILLATRPDVTVAGNAATVTLNMPQTLRMLGVPDWDGATAHFVRDPADKGWKVDLAKSFKYVINTPAGRQPADAEKLCAMFDTMAAVGETVAGEIAAHRIAGPGDVGARFEALLGKALAERNVPNVGCSLVPRDQ